jgi:hypothetical protein
MAGLQDELQDGGDWAGDTIKAVRKLKEIVARPCFRQPSSQSPKA